MPDVLDRDRHICVSAVLRQQLGGGAQGVSSEEGAILGRHLVELRGGRDKSFNWSQQARLFSDERTQIRAAPARGVTSPAIIWRAIATALSSTSSSVTDAIVADEQCSEMPGLATPRRVRGNREPSGIARGSDTEHFSPSPK